LEAIVVLGIYAALVYGCYSQATKKGYNVGLAVVLGLVLGLLAFIVYLIMPYKPEKLAHTV
jgi:hypothetical protein